MLPNDNVSFSMSVGHLYHVLIVYSSMSERLEDEILVISGAI